MTQPSLFRDTPEPRATKRVNVPTSSVEAFHRSGADMRIKHVLAMLVECPFTAPPTSRELAGMLARHPTTDDVLYVRRGLSDALALGLVEHADKRTCSVAGTLAITWKIRQR